MGNRFLSFYISLRCLIPSQFLQIIFVLEQGQTWGLFWDRFWQWFCCLNVTEDGCELIVSELTVPSLPWGSSWATCPYCFRKSVGKSGWGNWLKVCLSLTTAEMMTLSTSVLSTLARSVLGTHRHPMRVGKEQVSLSHTSLILELPDSLDLLCWLSEML